jgi:small-conductance mechanosensitive channel
MLLMIIGWWASKRASKAVDERVLGRMNLDQAMRYTFRKLIYYFFLFLTVLLTLRTVHVPLTVFTVIGGALAVGIGFGSQNLVNNFISGVLVMVEHPIRVGDYVEIDGLAFRIESIGIRTTHVRTGANAVLIIPNTTFIEKNLTNWSLSDVFSIAVRFGVAYGTDLKLLNETCFDCIKGVDGILPTPVPSLTFVDLGDNALIFDLGFSLAAYSYPGRGGIQSAVRFRLYEALRAKGIDMPFPQREVHVRVDKALPVQMQGPNII